MEDCGPFVEYVLRSGARTNVLMAVSEGRNSTQTLLDGDLASESAVYNALTELRDQGLIHEPRAKRWAPTGAGTVVAGLIERQREAESVLDADHEYWRSHDVTVLPRAFRSRIDDLAGGAVVRATDTRPSRAVRETERRLAEADSVAILAPIYNDRFDAAAQDGDSLRLVADAGVVDDLGADADGDGTDEDGTDDVRVAEFSFALTVTDDCLLLSLPTLDGSYDPRTEFIAESERARRWGRQLFDRYWEDAQALDAYLTTGD
jgi:predicted transcriptional regulator